jgi:hypothetical protein
MNMNLNWESLYRELEEQLSIILGSVARRMEELEKQSEESILIENIIIDKVGNSVRVTCVARANAPQFAFELQGPNGLKIPYDFSFENTKQFPLLLQGNYQVRCSVRDAMETNIVVSESSEKFEYSNALGLDHV